MKTKWDYTELADAYLERPEYAPQLLQDIFERAGLVEGSRVCDVGAGVAHLTIPLAQNGYAIDAVEPNDAMRANGIKRTKGFQNITWHEGTGENTGRDAGEYELVSFGSSFNVCDRQLALKEVYRILKGGRWFTCMWNHRQLDDPIQSRIESIIKSHVAEYGYGTRRESQTEVILESGLFENVQELTGDVVHIQQVDKVVEAWRSHGTLHRQAKDLFDDVIDEIESYLKSLGTESIEVPYTTRAWMAQKK